MLVDHHEVFRGGLASLLADEAGIEIVCEAGDGEQAVVVPVMKPDVAVLDLSLPRMSGIEATRLLAATAPLTRVLVLSVSANTEEVVDALLAGACGYLTKDASIQDIAAGVRAAAAGESVVSPAVATQLVRRLRATSLAPEVAGRRHDLTEREVEVLRLMAGGRDNAEIARMLYISPETAKNHVSSILAKLGAENRAQAAVFAVRAGLV